MMDASMACKVPSGCELCPFSPCPHQAPLMAAMGLVLHQSEGARFRNGGDWQPVHSRVEKAPYLFVDPAAGDVLSLKGGRIPRGL